ncbi:MAG: type I asparaginase [Bacteroidales bacterium]|nr:type I asparaginase [Bacteroidales bacterium]
MKPSVLIIYTGGTIGMKVDPHDQVLKPFDFSQIHDAVPELGKFSLHIDTHTFSKLIDSSDIEPSVWCQLACIIRDNYDSYDGFVVLHGTDTMAYSASALSFMLDGLAKPVVFTGSQLPIGAPRTDGRENLISAVEIASAKNEDGSARVPEVCIFFGEQLMRGNRTTKANAESFRAFVSPNCPPLASSGINIRYDDRVIRLPETPNAALSVNLGLDTRVSILKIHPGITPQVVKNILLGPETRAVIIETYGAGNAPSKEWFLDTVREAAAMGKLLVNITQCPAGAVDMDLYATGKNMKDAGVISGHDSTTEAMLAKLFHLLGSGLDAESIKQALERDLKGEITVMHACE